MPGHGYSLHMMDMVLDTAPTFYSTAIPIVILPTHTMRKVCMCQYRSTYNQEYINKSV